MAQEETGCPSDKMASESFLIEYDFSCPLCCDIFRDPVVLCCSHSSCKTCLEEYWKCKEDQECPVCSRISSMPFPAVSLTLKRLCEGFLQQSSRHAAGSERLCTWHKEKLKLFCLVDHQPVCLVCWDSRTHTGHKFCPIDGIVQDHKERVKVELEPLKEKLGLFTEAKLTCHQTAKYIKTQADFTQMQIRILHSGAQINVDKHLGSLQFRIWEKLQGIVAYFPVTLDPNTAHLDMLVYHDLVRFRLRDSLCFETDRTDLRPDNPESLNLHEGVLRSEGFDSGIHSWEVEVKSSKLTGGWDSRDWALGVVEQSVQRKGGWLLEYYGGVYSILSVPEEHIILTVTQTSQRIRMMLDWDGGKLTFFDPDDNEHLQYDHTHFHRETLTSEGKSGTAQ
uniref:Uncharacterized protein n=1 Tax=Hucho hucho TaxID=62062 RepID=A0A4W5LXR1_9TELE